MKETTIFRKHSGMLRTAEAIKLGIHPENLYAMRDQNKIRPIARGLYRLTNMPSLSHPDFSVIAHKVPHGVICLISALSFHGITLEIPHEVDLALLAGTEKPKLKYPPMHYVWLSGLAFSSGIETHKVDGMDLKIYSPEKTVADCFKFRNKIGLDVAIEALKLCREKKRSRPDTLMHYAKICRIENVIRPYLEAIL